MCVVNLFYSMPLQSICVSLNMVGFALPFDPFSLKCPTHLWGVTILIEMTWLRGVWSSEFLTIDHSCFCFLLGRNHATWCRRWWLIKFSWNGLVNFFPNSDSKIWIAYITNKIRVQLTSFQFTLFTLFYLSL